jgi:hypothetical protein
MPYFRLHHLLLIALVGSAARAGPVSVSDAQRARLADLVKTDAEAAKRFSGLRKDADAAMKEEPEPVRHILTEGKLKDDPDKVRTKKALADMDAMEALAWTYAVTGDKKYAERCQHFLLAWAKRNESRGDPIDDTNLDQAIVAYDLVRKTCSTAERKAVDAWLRQAADAEIESAEKGKGTKNNWHSHRLKIIGLVGLLLEDKKLIQYTIKAFEKHIDRNLEPDGSSLDFHERDALHYHCYDLEPLLTLCIAMEQAGHKLYGYTSPDGASLSKSVHFLKPYCEGTKTHAEWIHSRVAFDRKRAEAGDPHYKPGTLFEPKAGRKVMELAAYFEPKLNDLARKLSGNKAERFTTWRMVLNAAMKEFGA